MFRLPLARAAAGAAFAATIVACGSSTEPKKRDNVPATITSTTTGALTGQAGATLNTLLSVVVKNAAGQGADTALVTFAVTSGGGTVSNTTVRTDTTGVASTTWTLGGTAGAQTVTATVGTLPAVTFTATASAANASAIAKQAGDAQSATVNTNVGTAPSVKVTDKFGNPVANVLVNFAVATGGGSVTGASVNTNASGIATLGSWKLGAAPGANTLTATSPNVGSVTFTATGTVGAVAVVNITSATIPPLTIGQTATVTAAAFDASNNPVANAGITFSSSNTAVATVNATTGVVTAVGSGSSTISATANNISATTIVTVIGHPSVTRDTVIQMGGRIRAVAPTNTIVYAAISTTSQVKAVDLAADSVVWAVTVSGPVNGVAVNTAGTLVTAATSGTPYFYYVSPTTKAATDSLALAAGAARMVMTSTASKALVHEQTFQLEQIDVAGKTIAGTSTVAGTTTAMTMGPGDTVAYLATAFGNVFELNVATGAIKRTFQPSNTSTDVAVSPNGKTLFVADGTNKVYMIALATGGLSGTLDFGTANIQSIAMPPDASSLWAVGGNQVISAPFIPADNTFNTGLVEGRLTVTGVNMTKIVFTPNGSRAIAIDDGGLQLVIFK